MLKDTIQEDLKNAMIAKDEHLLSTIRMLKSALQYFEIQKGGAGYTGTDEDVIEVVGREIKKTRPCLVISPDGPRIEISGTAQLNAVARDIDGNVLPGRTFTWTSADAQRVMVSSTGLATWRAPGRTTVIARTGSASSSVTISTAGDFAVVGVHFTQGVQDESGTMPLVADGGPAAVLVVLSTQVRVTADMRVALRLLNAGGTLVHSDTEWVSAAIDAVPTVAQPAVRFLLPAAHIQSRLQWQIVRDPAGETPDDDAATDVYPRSGPAVLVVLVRVGPGTAATVMARQTLAVNPSPKMSP